MENIFSDDEKVKETVEKWSKESGREFFDTGIQKLMPQKCIDPNGDYVEKRKSLIKLDSICRAFFLSFLFTQLF